jgi:hypothetical protein
LTVCLLFIDVIKIILTIKAYQCYRVHRKCYPSVFCTSELITWTNYFETFSVDLDIKDHDGSHVLHWSNSQERIVKSQGSIWIVYKLQESLWCSQECRFIRCVCKIAKRVYYVRHNCLYEGNRLPIEGCTSNFIFEYLSQICRGNSRFFIIWKKAGTFQEGLGNFLIIAVWIHLSMRNISDKPCGENQK